MKKKKYPASLFVLGFIAKLVRNYKWIRAAIVVYVAGIWVQWCTLVGFALLLSALTLSLRQQLETRNAVLNSDNPNFKDVQEALLSPNWKDNLIAMAEDAAETEENEETEA